MIYNLNLNVIPIENVLYIIYASSRINITLYYYFFVSTFLSGVLTKEFFTQKIEEIQEEQQQHQHQHRQRRRIVFLNSLVHRKKKMFSSLLFFSFLFPFFFNLIFEILPTLSYIVYPISFESPFRIFRVKHSSNDLNPFVP